MFKKRKTGSIRIGNMYIGSDYPVSIQSMTNTKTSDFEATFAQVKALSDAGCEIVRLAVPDVESAGVFTYLKENGINIPLVADIHFDYKIAIASAECGADKIRINPGNIGSPDRVKAVVDICKQKNIPIRVGVNSGSLEKSKLDKYGHVTPEGLAESALDNIRLLERYDFDQIVVAIKSSDVPTMIAANEVLAESCFYPIHLGVTEAGTTSRGIVKSAVGIGSLLTRGIGDTIRVSLTSDPVNEVIAAKRILEYCGVRENDGIEVVSCPTCGRTNIDLIGMCDEFDRRSGEISYSGKIKVAIMGCAVNGPGEAREADIGIAGGIGQALLFKKGEVICKIPEEKAIDVLIEEINKM